MEYSNIVQETSKKLNLIRIELKEGSLLSTEFTKIFKDRKIAYAIHLPAFLIKKKILVKLDNDEYAFTDRHQPIHIKISNEFIKFARELQQKYNKTYNEKQKSSVVNLATKNGFKLKTKEGFLIDAEYQPQYKVAKINDQLAIIDNDNNIIRVL